MNVGDLEAFERFVKLRAGRITTPGLPIFGSASGTLGRSCAGTSAEGYDRDVKTKAGADLRDTLGQDPVVEAYKRGVDRTLLRENLSLSVEERLRRLMRLQALAEEVGRAGRAAKARS